jgi:AraC family transcriptional regulator
VRSLELQDGAGGVRDEKLASAAPSHRLGSQLSNFVRRRHAVRLPAYDAAMRANIIKRVCAAGTVEHAWLPDCGEDGYVSVSAPSGICLTFNAHLGCLVTINGKRLQRDVEPGCVQIAGPEPIYWHVVREPSDVVEVTAPPEVRRAIAEEIGVPQAAELDDLHGGTDPIIWAIAARIRTSLRTVQESADLEYDELIRHLYGHVFATRFGGRLPTKRHGKLDRRRLERVTAYIEEHLADTSLSVAVLAEVASLSAFHFLRSFRRTFHMTPHSYVRARRLERIREALTTDNDPIDVARRYGFTHLRHFHSAFSRHHGMAPGKQLADVLPLS